MDGGLDEIGSWLCYVVGGGRYIGRWAMCLIRHELVVSRGVWTIPRGLVTSRNLDREGVANTIAMKISLG